MKKTCKTTNEKANTILDVISTMNELKEIGEIQFVNYKWDEKNNTFDVCFTPKQEIKYLDINITVHPSGMTFQ